MLSIKTNIPGRLDRLPWSRFHGLIVLALGITWILDGLEVTLVGSIGPVLQKSSTLAITVQQLGLLASIYVTGAVTGALLFGWLTDRLGRRVVFYATLIIYLSGVLLSALSWSFLSLALFRFITGFGIGGEYAAINSAIDELIPAKYRGRVDILVNGSFWLGAAAGAGASLVLLNTAYLPVNLGWRLGFGIGGIMGLGILLLRGYVPESPRWLVTHSRQQEADQIVDDIERQVVAATGRQLSAVQDYLEIEPQKSFGFGLIFRAMLGEYRERSLLALTLMIAQAFLFNSVFFTYGLVLTQYQHVPANRTGVFMLPLTLGSFLGPLLLGHLFDTVGRRRMIAGTFGLSGVLLLLLAYLFQAGMLTALTQTCGWVVVFFFASAAASSAYLTASEIFPLETRALAIACFYAFGTAIGGVMAPWLYARLIASQQPENLAWGYAGAALLLLVATFAEVKAGIDSEGKSLEQIAKPLSQV